MRRRYIKWQEMGDTFFRIILDLVYPRRCPLCGKVLPFGQGMVCEDCLKGLKRVKPPFCMRCGKSVLSEETEYCQDCMTLPKSFKRGYPVFFYTGAIKDALYAFKYKNQQNYADFFVECIYQSYGRELKRLSVDAIVPVPLHFKKRRKRGYNQAELIAHRLGKRLGVPVLSKYLIRSVNTSPQKELNEKIRMQNLKNAFKISKNAVKLKKVLLVDDIYTSGATIEACTKVLQSAGVEDVYYTSVAIGRGYSG